MTLFFTAQELSKCTSTTTEQKNKQHLILPRLVHFVLLTCNIYYVLDNRKIYPFNICNKAQESSIDGREYNLYSGDARFDLFTVYLMNLSVTEARQRPALALTRKKLIRKAVKKGNVLNKGRPM